MADKSNASGGLLSTQEGYQKLNNFTAAAVFLFVLGVFYSTMAPTVSFWDCGEYIASSYTLGIPHPPGNPLYVLLGRVFTMIFSWTDQVAFRVNLMSIFAGALTALTLFKIVTRSIRSMIGEVDTAWKGTIGLIASTTGALFGVFNYTVWFSAVEASVYIPAVLMVVLNVYVALVWAQSKDENRDKYLLLFAYLAFLGIGIHMMSMFALFPVFLFIILTDTSKLKDWRLWAVALLMGSVIYSMGAFIFIAPFLFVLTAVYAFMPRMIGSIIGAIIPMVFYAITVKYVNVSIPEFQEGAQLYEMWEAIKSSDLFPFLMLQVFTIVELIIYFANKRNEDSKPLAWHFAFGVVLMALMGYSTHAYIPIRSALEPMIDENHPVIEFSGSDVAARSYQKFIEEIKDQSNQSVIRSYSGFIRVAMANPEIDSLYKDVTNGVANSEYMLPSYNAFMDAIEKDPTVSSKYDAFLATLEEDGNGVARVHYENYESGVSERKVEWSAFRNFLERKQYGSESMITRMFHRRGAITTQFGIDGHMGYGGFHITQFFHFGEDINVDRQGSGADGRESFKRNNVLTGALSPEYEAKMFLDALTDTEKSRIAGMIQVDDLEITSAITLLRAAEAISEQNINIDGVDSFIAKRNMMRWFKRVGVIFVYLLPTLLVIFSWGYWFKADWRVAVLLTSLVLTTSVALVFYMNFADGTRVEGAEYRNWKIQSEQARQQGYRIPEPNPVHREVRIRDYFYTTGFTFFGMWIGLAIAALLHLLYSGKGNPIRKGLASTVALLAAIAPLLPLYSNYGLNNRTQDWIPYDYAYNLLNSCEQDGILFTNGDNDTFPLWFLQEAEGVRRDVRIVNLSLVNTTWYIKQLKRLNPVVPISYSERQIDGLQPMLNPVESDAQAVHEMEEAGITVIVPTREQKRVLYVQNMMVLNIVEANAWEKPVYFSVTVSQDNLMGLQPFLKQEGMVYRVTTAHIPREEMMNFDRTRFLLDKVYQFRGLGDNSTPLSETARKLMNNYAQAFIQFNMALEPELNKVTDRLIEIELQLAKDVAVSVEVADTVSVIDSIVGNITADRETLVSEKASLEIEKQRLVDEISNKYNRCVSIMPWDARSRNFRHEFLIRQGLYEEALIGVNEALLVEPDSRLFLSWESQLEQLAGSTLGMDPQ